MRDTHASTSTWKGCGMALAVLQERLRRCRAVQAHHSRRICALLLLHAQVKAAQLQLQRRQYSRAECIERKRYSKTVLRTGAAIAERAKAQQATLANLSWARHLESPQQQQCALQRPERPAATPPCLLVCAHVRAAVPTHSTSLPGALSICKQGP